MDVNQRDEFLVICYVGTRGTMLKPRGFYNTSSLDVVREGPSLLKTFWFLDKRIPR